MEVKCWTKSMAGNLEQKRASPLASLLFVWICIDTDANSLSELPAISLAQHLTHLYLVLTSPQVTNRIGRGQPRNTQSLPPYRMSLLPLMTIGMSGWSTGHPVCCSKLLLPRDRPTPGIANTRLSGHVEVRQPDIIPSHAQSFVAKQWTKRKNCNTRLSGHVEVRWAYWECARLSDWANLLLLKDWGEPG